jgi:hypothetical protein
VKTNTIRLSACLATALLFELSRAEAQVNIWTNPISGRWEAPTNWSLGLPPANTQSLFITNIGADLTLSSSVVAKQVILDAATSSNFPSTMTVSNVMLTGAATNVVNWLDLTNVGTNVPLHVLRQATVGTGSELTVSNSSLQVDNLLSVGAPPPPGFIANFPALLLVDSGSVQAANIALGNVPNSLGILDLFSGTVNTVGLNVGGSAGPGSVVEYNGSINVLGNLTILSPSLTVTSSVAVLGGSFIATNGPIQVGPFGSGLFSVSGGNHVMRQILLGGPGPISSGLFVMSGGTLQILGNGAGPGQGVVANSWDIGYADVDGTGTSITIGDNGHSASASLTGGFMKFAAMYAGYQPGYAGTYTQLAGTMVITSNLVVGADCPDGPSGAVGTVTVSGGGALYVTNASHTAVLNVHNGTFTLGLGTILAVDNLVTTDACGQFIDNGGIVLPGNAFYTTNLLLNPGAEDGALSHWTASGNIGVDHSLEILPNTGGYCFSGEGNGASMTQTVSLVGNQGITASALDSGQLVAHVSFFENQSVVPPPYDNAQVTLTFLDAGMNALGSNSTPQLQTPDGNWANSTLPFPIPSGTRFINYTVNFTPSADGDIVFVDDTLLLVSGPPSPPALTVSNIGTNVLLSWPAWASNGILQFTTNLSAINSWQDLTNTPAGTSGGFFVTDSLVGPDRFYRLRTP